MRTPSRVLVLTLGALLTVPLLLASGVLANHGTGDYRLPVSRGTIVKHPIGGGEAQFSEHRPTSPVMNIVVVPPPPIPNSAHAAAYLEAVLDSLRDLDTAGDSYGAWFENRVTWDYQVASENLSPLTALDIEILIVADASKGPVQWLDTRQTNRVSHLTQGTGSPCVVDNSLMLASPWSSNQMYNGNIAAVGRCLGLDGENLHPQDDAFAATVFGDRVPPPIPTFPSPPTERRCPSNLDARAMEAAFSTSVPSETDFHVGIVPVSQYVTLTLNAQGKCAL